MSWMLCNDTHMITLACCHWVCISTTHHNMEKYNYVMALLSLCASKRSATHDMIKTHTTRAHENTSSTHDLHHMNEMYHYPHIPSISIDQVCSSSLTIYYNECRILVVKGYPQSSGSLPAPPSGHATIIMVVFDHLLILEDRDPNHNLISSSLYHPGPLHKISLQSVPNFLSNVAH